MLPLPEAALWDEDMLWLRTGPLLRTRLPKSRLFGAQGILQVLPEEAATHLRLPMVPEPGSGGMLRDTLAATPRAGTLRGRL